MSEGANALLSEETTAGNYFISNYPPYSFWNPEQVSQAHAALDRPPRPNAALGMYVHIPFCRKRCHFCYFKVYTGKDSDEIYRYLDAVVRELTLYSEKLFIGGRKPSFIYFGGGTPSYISTRQLSRIVDAMKRQRAWDQAEEIAFECEPGTITEGKLEILKQMGWKASRSRGSRVSIANIRNGPATGDPRLRRTGVHPQGGKHFCRAPKPGRVGEP